MEIYIVMYTENTSQEEGGWPVRAFSDYQQAEDYIIEMNKLVRADYFYIAVNPIIFD